MALALPATVGRVRLRRRTGAVLRTGAPRAGGSARRSIATVLAAAVLVGAVVFFGWFRTGQAHARGDIAVPVRDGLAAELGDQWTHQNTGAGGPTYELVRLPELAAQRLGRALGGGEALGQRLLYTAEYGFAAGAVAALVLVVVRRRASALAGSVVAFANPYTLNTVPNTLPLLAVGIVAAVLVPFVVAAEGTWPTSAARRRWLVAGACLATLPASYLSVNPPLLALVAVATATAPVVAAALTGTGRAGAARALRFALRTAPWAVLLHLWWLVPMGFALTRAVDAGTVQAETDVVAWSWTQRNNSVANVLTFIANWTWGDPVYHSRAVVDAAPALEVAAWTYPAVVVAAPLVARPRWRRPALWALLALGAVVPLAKGLHAPLAGANAWVFRHVPGAWLFREPMSKLGVVLVVALAVAAGVLVDGVAGRLRRWWQGGRRAVAVGCLLALAAPAAASWPLWTGSWVQDADGARPGARVELPAAWREVAATVNGSGLEGKALVLPLGDFYQLPTTWGYYGIDNTARHLLTRPVIVRQPELYIGDPPAFDALARGAESALLGGDPATATAVLRALGVSHVLVRHDIDRDSAIRRPAVADDGALAVALGGVDALDEVLANEVATVFEVAGEDGWSTEPVQVLGGLLRAPSVLDEDLPALVAGTEPGLAVATGGDAGDLDAGWAWAGPVGDATVLAAPGPIRVEQSAGQEVLARLSADGGTLVVEDPVSVAIGGSRLEPRPVQRVDLAGDGAPLVGIEVEGASVDLTEGPVTVSLSPGTSVTPLLVEPGGSRLGAWGEVADCNRRRDVDLADVGIEGTTTDDGVALRAEAHAACIAAPVDARAGDVLRVSLSARSLEGGPARACLWFPALGACGALPPLIAPEGTWTDVVGVVTVPPGAGAVQLYLYADAPTDAGPTATAYRDVAVEALRRGAARDLALEASTRSDVAVGDGADVVTVEVGSSEAQLGAWGPVADCLRVEGRSLEDAGITARRLPRGIELRAAQGRACVTAPIAGVDDATVLEVTFLAAGDEPSLCVWQSALRRCAPVLRREAAERGAGVAVEERVAVGGGAGPLELFLYAEPTGEERAEVRYLDLAARVLPQGTLRLQDAAAAPGPVPDLTWAQEGPTRYRVRISGAGAPYVLALADTFTTDWRLSGLPGGGEARHVELDGYRNGWVVDARGDYELVLEYQPARYGRFARATSVFAATLGGVLLLPRRPVRRRPR